MTSTAPTQDQLAPHVDHDVSQLLLLHRQINSFWFRFYPEVLQRAAVVAYATHFRALLEFFHDGRPSRNAMTAAGCESPDDIRYSTFVGSMRPAWSQDEKLRLCDADKLAGHLSTGRVCREGPYPVWASAADLDLVRDHIRGLLAAIPPCMLPKSRQSSSTL